MCTVGTVGFRGHAVWCMRPTLTGLGCKVEMADVSATVRVICGVFVNVVIISVPTIDDDLSGVCHVVMSDLRTSTFPNTVAFAVAISR